MKTKHPRDACLGGSNSFTYPADPGEGARRPCSSPWPVNIVIKKMAAELGGLYFMSLIFLDPLLISQVFQVQNQDL